MRSSWVMYADFGTVDVLIRSMELYSSSSKTQLLIRYDPIGWVMHVVRDLPYQSCYSNQWLDVAALR